mgnify:CR=1 FL=1
MGGSATSPESGCSGAATGSGSSSSAGMVPVAVARCGEVIETGESPVDGETGYLAKRGSNRLPEIALIEMGDFAGAVLKHLRRAPVEKLSLCGGFGKISKLAGGHLDLHSRHSSIDLPQLAGWAAALGASTALQDSMRAANTSQQALAQAHAEGVALGDAVCAHALRFARGIVPTEVALEVFAIDRQGNLVGQACEERR